MTRPTEEDYENGVLVIAQYVCNICKKQSPWLTFSRSDGSPIDADDIQNGINRIFNELMPLEFSKLGWSHSPPDMFICSTCKN